MQESDIGVTSRRPLTSHYSGEPLAAALQDPPRYTPLEAQ